MCKTSIRKADSSSIIQYNKRRYSVPSTYRGQKFNILDCDVLRIYNEKYCREYKRKVTTIYPEDYLDSEMKVNEEIERILLISALVGRHIFWVSKFLIKSKPHPYLSFRTIEAIFYLADEFGCDRVENASKYALEVEKPYYYLIKKLVKADGIHSD